MLILFPLDAVPPLGGRVRGHRRSLLFLDVIAAVTLGSNSIDLKNCPKNGALRFLENENVFVYELLESLYCQVKDSPKT